MRESWLLRATHDYHATHRIIAHFLVFMIQVGRFHRRLLGAQHDLRAERIRVCNASIAVGQLYVRIDCIEYDTRNG